MIKNENYITIQGFMINDLNVKGNELLIYAIIYGFTQAENQEFKGSLQYLADWCNSTKQGVIKALKSLLDKDLIEKQETVFNNVKFVGYVTKFNSIKQSLTGYSTKFNEGIKQSLPNNINNNNINNNRWVKPTIDEIKAYCDERNNGINAEQFYDFYESKNWYVGKNKMKDWKACVRTWEQRSKPKHIVTEPDWLNETPKEYSKYSNEGSEEAKKLIKELFED